MPPGVPVQTRMFSVACRAIPHANGDGADGCGRGWTQRADESRTCDRCGRRLFITDEYVVIPLRRPS